MLNTLPKSEHLKKRNEIIFLFKNSISIDCWPVKVIYCKSIDCSKVKVLFSAPKKLFKKAVDRNYHKRLLREAYRLNKQKITHLIAGKEFGLNIGFIIQTNERQNFSTIQNSVVLALQIIENEQNK